MIFYYMTVIMANFMMGVKLLLREMVDNYECLFAQNGYITTASL